jgi:hypothetical protein
MTSEKAAEMMKEIDKGKGITCLQIKQPNNKYKDLSRVLGQADLLQEARKLLMNWQTAKSHE